MGPDAMQSFIEVAPGYIVVLPNAQAVHATDPVAFAYVPIGHSMHMAPLGLNLPAAQSMQLVGSEEVGEGILPGAQVTLPPPGGELEQVVEPGDEVWPAAHAKHMTDPVLG